MKPTLLVMAAGMGSRFGGLKQLSPLGPNNEIIMDYSIYDAIQAGFGKVVFVIRHSFEDDFQKLVLSKYKGLIQTEIVFQETSKLPAPFTCPKEREKPWGTNHAVLMAKDIIKEPFCVINADDFYGREAFQIMAENLSKLKDTEKGLYFMTAYNLGNTLSESGTVSRGICSPTEDDFLKNIEEYTKLKKSSNQEMCIDENTLKEFSIQTPVSMNFWGFTPDYFDYSEKEFVTFLNSNLQNPKSEFYIPFMVDTLIQNKLAKVKILTSKAHWFGVTYPEDKDEVITQLKTLVEKGVYPSPLF